VIINCKCGKFQFDVKKSDVGIAGREVQCGICNKKWLYGKKFNSKNTLFAGKLFIFTIFFLAIIIILECFEDFFITSPFQIYYFAKEAFVLNITQLYYLAKEVFTSNVGPYLK